MCLWNNVPDLLTASLTCSLFMIKHIWKIIKYFSEVQKKSNLPFDTKNLKAWIGTLYDLEFLEVSLFKNYNFVIIFSFLSFTYRGVPGTSFADMVSLFRICPVKPGVTHWCNGYGLYLYEMLWSIWYHQRWRWRRWWRSGRKWLQEI